MIKKIILLFVLALGTSYAFAQEDGDESAFKFGLGGTIAVPLSNLKQITSYGVGFEVLGVYNVSESIAGFAQIGVDVFKGSDSFDDNPSLLHLPVIVGARYKAGGFFLGLGGGYGHFSSDGYSTGGFLVSSQVGYDLGKLQVILDYTSTAVTGGNLSYIGLQAFHTF